MRPAIGFLADSAEKKHFGKARVLHRQFPECEGLHRLFHLRIDLVHEHLCVHGHSVQICLRSECQRLYLYNAVVRVVAEGQNLLDMCNRKYTNCIRYHYLCSLNYKGNYLE